MTNPFPEKPELFDEEGDSMAFGLGLGDGVKKLKPLPSRYKSAEANPYYYYPGFCPWISLQGACGGALCLRW